MRRLAACILLITLCAAAHAAPSAKSLVDKARANMTPARDYVVDLRMDVSGSQLLIKGMAMTLYFKKPGKTRIVAKEGFSAMPTSMMLGDAVSELMGASRATLVKTARRGGVECYVVRLEPASKRRGQPVTLWLDKSRLLVRAMRVDGPCPVECDWRYATVDEKYSLPRRIDARITIASPRGYQQPNRPDPDDRRSRHNPRTPKPTLQSATETMRATVTFSNYRVNKGIPDSVFTSKDPPRR